MARALLRPPAMRLLVALSVLACPLLLGSACGSPSPKGSGSKGGGGAGETAGGGAGETAGGGAGETAGGSAGGMAGGGAGGTETSAPAPCPATLPTFNSACPAAGLICSYGDNPRPSCRSLMACAGIIYCNCGSDTCPPSECTTTMKSWSGGGPGSGVGFTDRCAWTCPATPPNVGDPCTSGYCAEPDGTQCGCVGSDSHGQSVWACVSPPSDPRCPRVAPLIGSACSNEGLACGDYDICATGSRVLCKSGVWVDNIGACPK
jgi:hypothetical protein